MPSREELLIIALDLGGSGNNYDSVNPNNYDSVNPGPVAVPLSIHAVDNWRCPHYGGNGKICHHISGNYNTVHIS